MVTELSGFYYVAGLTHAAEGAERRLFFHRLDDSGVDHVEPLRGLSYCSPQVSSDGRYVVLLRGSREPRADLILDRTASEGWKLFLNDIPAACHGFIHASHYVAITTLGAERGRVVAIPLATASDFSTWHELIPSQKACCERSQRSMARSYCVILSMQIPEFVFSIEAVR